MYNNYILPQTKSELDVLGEVQALALHLEFSMKSQQPAAVALVHMSRPSELQSSLQPVYQEV